MVMLCWKMATTAHSWATELWSHHPPPAKSKRMCHSKADSEAQLVMVLDKVLTGVCSALNLCLPTYSSKTAIQL